MAEQRLGDPAMPEGLVDFGRPEDTSKDSPRNRRVMWISVAAVVVLAAASIPIGLHFLRHSNAGLHTPTHVAGLTLDTSSDAKSTTDYLSSAVAAGMNLDTSVAAVYTPGGPTAQADAHSVIFIGGTVKGSDATLLSQVLAQMADSTDGIGTMVTEDPGSLGGLMKCGLTTDTSTQDSGTADEMAICAFAGGNEVGVALFPNRTVLQAAPLMRQIRAAVV
jgi:hypothetical protein